MSARQLRRVVQAEFGVTPIELAQTKRLLLAKQLIADTSLSMIDVAFSSGFDSVRRFNTAFKSCYGFTPSSMRRQRNGDSGDGCIQLTIGYRPPFAWQEFIQFLQPRLTPGVEAVIDDSYIRSIQINDCIGWFQVTHCQTSPVLKLNVSVDLLPVLSPLLSGIRRFLDVDARPDVIATHLRQSSILAPLLHQHPGLRVPGTVDPFELTVRAILGQQISVKAATTLAGRLAAEYGEPVTTPFEAVNRISPTALRLSRARTTKLKNLGILLSRAETIRSLAREVSTGRLGLCGTDLPLTLQQLKRIRGIGDWTAQYVAMRAFQWPDAFPESDLGLQKATIMADSELRAAADSWRPWRSYAAGYLWQSLSDATAAADTA